MSLRHEQLSREELRQLELTQIVLTKHRLAHYYSEVHNIQRKILNKLLYATSLGYAQMRPEGVESNHFAYHLDQLVKNGLIVKEGREYFLSPAGLTHIDRLSQEKMTERAQPHILTVIDITNDAGQTLLYKRAFQPFIYTYAFPLGKTHMEESIVEAAVRELQEKTSLSDITLRHRGIAYLTVTAGDHLITKELCHVFSATIVGTPALPAPTKRGTCVWADASAMKASEFMPGFLAIKKLLKENDSLFFAEITEKA